MSESSNVVMDSSSASSGDNSSVVMVTDEGTSGSADSTSLEEDPPLYCGHGYVLATTRPTDEICQYTRRTACRLPGGVHSPSDLWDLLVKQVSAQGPVPPERYNINGFYDAKGNRSGTTNVPGGYFLDEDQRKLLEVVYKCLMNSGTLTGGVAGSITGVYAANFSVDYQPI
ncbi:Uu.00g012970.m01.CDS01 [Anthostomella pinea]|uniref:Uu.00g012970.m01.CDS01 n=1 Tax=Anthostomella pinea TaxID=933095 RepID=A0AAI8VY20_9PEZI|nr:Uu.00g012970.m01.CDS01 [Anthostomella pinea]